MQGESKETRAQFRSGVLRRLKPGGGRRARGIREKLGPLGRWRLGRRGLGRWRLGTRKLGSWRIGLVAIALALSSGISTLAVGVRRGGLVWGSLPRGAGGCPGPRVSVAEP